MGVNFFKMEKIIFYTGLYFDYIFIQHVKNIRKEKKKSQVQLSLEMGLSKTFVGNVENINERHKYSTRHIALLSKALGFKNIGKLMDIPTPEFDKVKLTIKQTLNDTGTKVLKEVIIKIEPVK